MSVMAYQITGVSIVYSIVCSGADQSKHQSYASQAFARGIDRWPVNSSHKGQQRGKCFHLMTSGQSIYSQRNKAQQRQMLIYALAQRSWCGVYWIGFTLSVRPSVDDMVSGAWLMFASEFQFQISYACALWLWTEAFLFSAMLLSKWPPGSHIGFFSFWTLILV